ncbi:hypothetical protein [Bacillus sp. 1P02SD]|uniref:hypothetical protein n=1 Tax=Bacillus sp. 1P02SD TaxID=3132264 RepID=UPI0039A355BF
MKTDIFIKFLLSGILVSLIVIAFNTDIDDNVQTSIPNVDVENQGGRVVQIAPNRIGIVDTGNRSGWEQLVVFDYNPETKQFEVVGSIPYEDIFNHPEEFEISTKDDKYGN